MSDPTRFSSVVLVDPRGWLLLQERDEHPVIDPDCWSLVGGHVEEGEDLEAAAYRELAEETGVRMHEGLRRFATYEFHDPGSDHDHQLTLWYAATELGPDQIETNEGRQITFVDPKRLHELQLSPIARRALPALLESPGYAELVR